MSIPNLVLVGFMGTGKSAIGQRLAVRLQLEFIDMDERIEARQGRTISAIFAQDGEPAFRTLERNLVRELAPPQGRVIATGGGVVLNPDNIRDFQAGGLVICLKAQPEIIFQRVAQNRNRPLLNTPDPRARIAALLAERNPFYEAISESVDTSALSISQIVDDLAARYARFRAGRAG